MKSKVKEVEGVGILSYIHFYRKQPRFRQNCLNYQEWNWFKIKRRLSTISPTVIIGILFHINSCRYVTTQTFG